MARIKLIISDFDGTLVDTFNANYFSYLDAFKECGLDLKLENYKSFFGLRFDSFMIKAGVTNDECKRLIKEHKRKVFEDYFHYIRLNVPLMELLKSFKRSGGIVAIASTADRINLLKITNYFGITESFDMILTGEEVVSGKPNPEIYLKLMKTFDVYPYETLIFEDSKVGLEAAKAANSCYIKVSNHFFNAK